VGPVLFRQLGELGLGAEYVRQVVITHAHPDHVMAVPLLRDRFPQIKVLASQPAAAALATEETLTLFRQLDEALTSFLVRSGTISDADLIRSAGAGPITVDRIVGEGDVVDVEDIAWTVLATQGHSDCSICLHDPRRHLLVISDATGYYMPQRGAWWPCYFSDYGAYVASIERLQALEAEILCLSHNGAIQGREDVRAYFDGALAATRDYHQRILEAIRSGKAVRQLAEELGSAIHAHTGFLPLEFFQKNCGLLVKQSLRHEGLAGAPRS
jgi:glyoxylase-like metal-dependent hydrolase (beta-lactamase superfamily II)